MTITPSSPITVVSTVSSERIRLLRVLITSADPSITLPAGSCGWASHTAFQLPTSDQRNGDRQHRRQRGALHHGIVDRFLRRLCERRFGEAIEVEVGGEVVDGGLGRLSDLGFEAAEFAQHHLGTEHEVAAVPQIAVGDVAGGGRRVGLLDEGLDFADRAVVLGRVRADVAVARCGVGRLDPEGDDRTRHRRRQRRAARIGELVAVRDQVIGGDHQQDRAGIRLDREFRRGGDGGRGIAPLRLQDDGGLDAPSPAPARPRRTGTRNW